VAEEGWPPVDGGFEVRLMLVLELYGESRMRREGATRVCTASCKWGPARCCVGPQSPLDQQLRRGRGQMRVGDVT
jgi:hypothetical protein